MERFWDRYESWDSAEDAWDRGLSSVSCEKTKEVAPLRGIAPETKRGLRRKILGYMIAHDTEGVLRRYVLKNPIRYAVAYMRSLLRKKPHWSDGDFFFYNVSSREEFEKLLVADDTILILGFSYCQKPHSCPAGRFNDHCHHDVDQSVCRQCFMGKAYNAISGDVVPLVATTVHAVGEKIFDIVTRNPEKRVVFLMTACELSLTMFGDWGNMAGITGVGVRLRGPICTTFKAFEAAENGVKPTCTLLGDEAEKYILSCIRLRRMHRRAYYFFKK